MAFCVALNNECLVLGQIITQVNEISCEICLVENLVLFASCIVFSQSLWKTSKSKKVYVEF